jgi:putative membrane protein
MNTKPVARLSRVASVGAALGAAIFAVSTLQAQTTEPAPAAPAAAESLSHRAKEFIKDAAEANQTEIAMANVADGKSQNDKVKDLAQMIRTDHQQNYAQLQAVAQAHGVTIDTAPDLLHRWESDHLKNAKSDEFDQEFAKLMLKDHVKTIKRFDKAAMDIQEADVKQYAQSTLPALRKHLRHAEEVARAVGVNDETISSLLKGLPSDQKGVTAR